MTTIHPSQSHSPLGELSKLYLTKTDKNGSILDQPDKGLIELYPAGYTKRTATGSDRQAIYRQIWELAVQQERESYLYPFGKDSSHSIDLLLEQSNEYDPNAVKIILRAPVTSPLYLLNGADLGYIPKRISFPVTRNIRMFTDGKILKVRSEVHEKYWNAKIVLSYSEMKFTSLSQEDIGRFSAIMED